MEFPILNATKHHADVAVVSRAPILTKKSIPFAWNRSTPQASKSRSKMAELRQVEESMHPRMFKDTSARVERHAYMTCAS